MSEEAPVEVMDEVEVEVAAEETEAEIVWDPKTALQSVLRTSLYHDGLARGLYEAVKALDKNLAHLCVLSKSCNEKAYTTLITALCKEHNVDLIMVEQSKELGEMAGLCKYNAEGKAVKVVGASCVVIKSWGEETPARQWILEHVKSLK